MKKYEPDFWYQIRAEMYPYNGPENHFTHNVTAIQGRSQTFQNEGAARGTEGVIRGVDWDSKWWLSIDLCTKCNFIGGMCLQFGVPFSFAQILAVLICNLKTAWPTKVSLLFLSSLNNLLIKMHMLFFTKMLIKLRYTVQNMLIWLELQYPLILAHTT